MTRYRLSGGTLEVDAIKIVWASDYIHCLIPEDPGFNPIEVSEDWIRRNQAKRGGYFLRFENGHMGFMAVELFERAFIPIAGDRQP